MFLQQGDVLIKKMDVKVKNDPKKFTNVRNGYCVVAEGEATGHFHGIPDIEGVDFWMNGDEIWMENDHPVTIIHQEHKPIEIPVGVWQFSQVNEYDPFEDTINKVRD